PRDDPRFDFADVEHVARAKMAQLVEVEDIVRVRSKPPVELVRRWQLAHERGPDRFPGRTPVALPELPARDCPPEKVDINPARKPSDSFLRGRRHVQYADAAVLGLRLTPKPTIELGLQMIDVALE